MVSIYVENLFFIHSHLGWRVVEDELRNSGCKPFCRWLYEGRFFPGFAYDLNSSIMFLLAALVQGLFSSDG